MYPLSIFLLIILALVSITIPVMNDTFDCQTITNQTRLIACEELQTQGWTIHAILVPVLMGALVVSVIIETKNRKKKTQNNKRSEQ